MLKDLLRTLIVSIACRKLLKREFGNLHNNEVWVDDYESR